VYPSIFLILSALLLVSALSSYLALITHNAENRWTEHRLRLSFGAGSDTLRRIYAEVLLMFLCIGLCTGIILELGYDSFLKYMQMPECDVMQWFAGVWTGMLVILMILCTIPVYLQNRKYHRAISGAPQGKPSLFNYGFVLTQVTVSVLLLYLVWNGGRQLHYACNDALGFNAKDVYTFSFVRDEDKPLLRGNEFAHEMSQISAVDTCIMLCPFFNPESVTAWIYDGKLHYLAFVHMTQASIRLFDIKPNWWKPIDENTELTKEQALVSINSVEYYGVTPEKPYLPDGETEVVGTIDIRIDELHKEARYWGYGTRYAPPNGEDEVPYFCFLPGREKEGIVAVEELLRRRDINVDAGLVRVVNFGDLISDTYEKEQNYLTLYTILAIVGFGIAFFGLLTLVSADLQRQRRSLAIRRIFGATYGVCLRQTLRLYSIVTTLGTVIGLCIGFYLMTMWLETYTTSITLGWEQPVCIALGIAVLVTSLVSWKVRQCFREKPANVIAN
ncbi:MAG: ABC transporter permease, partial [Bacteroidaceae bacterium]|nr:ABC transporter permease [Bacteroidaceae bacterium]